MKSIDFVKMVASGNDFVLINARKEKNSITPAFVKSVCQRKYGIGADGVLLLETSSKADIKMRIFNPDGSEVSMCGNGARCVALYAKSKIKNEKLKIETQAGILEAEVDKDKVRLKMSNPCDTRLNLKLSVDNQEFLVHCINTGVPHVVHFIDDLKGFDVEGIGRKIRYHDEFKPEGTNANFVKVISEDKIQIRTYERGVEAETLACGTGTVASALIHKEIADNKEQSGKVEVITKGGEALGVYFEREKKGFHNVYLEGRAKIVYNGRIEDV